MGTTRTPTRKLALVAAVIAATALAGDAAGAAKTVEIDARKAGPRVPKHFVGFSGEFQFMRDFVAQPGTGVANRPVVQLSRNLAAWGGGAPVLRIGGGSTDGFWFDNGSNAAGLGDFYAVDDAWLEDVRAYLEASRSPLIIGVNLARNDPQAAAEWAAAVAKAFPRGLLKALEIGNEPDNYTARELDQATGKMTRAKTYGPPQYLRELYAYTRAIHNAVPRAPMAGPSTIAEYAEWRTAFPKIIANQRKRLSFATVHRYPVLACGKKPGTYRRVKPLELMNPAAVDGQYASLNELAIQARAYGKRLRITESNSVACGGAQGVSDTFASTLWGVDWLFTMAAAGVEGVDFHTSSGLYQPYYPSPHVPGERRLVVVRPLYYGMLMFAEATAHRSRLIEIGYPGPDLQVHTWPTYDPVDRVVRVAVINKSGRRQRVRLAIRRASAKATLKRLTGPSLTATEGIRIGGRRFAELSYSGKLRGRPRLERVRRRGGRFSVRLARYGAALLTVPIRR